MNHPCRFWKTLLIMGIAAGIYAVYARVKTEMDELSHLGEEDWCEWDYTQ